MSSVKVHPDGTGALKKTGPASSRRLARYGCRANGSPGQAYDAPEGRKLLHRLGPQQKDLSIVMDRAYEGNETRQLALELGFAPVVPPLSSRVAPWEYDKELYKRRNEVDGCSDG